MNETCRPCRKPRSSWFRKPRQRIASLILGRRPIIQPDAAPQRVPSGRGLLWDFPRYGRFFLRQCRAGPNLPSCFERDGGEGRSVEREPHWTLPVVGPEIDFLRGSSVGAALSQVAQSERQILLLSLAASPSSSNRLAAGLFRASTSRVSKRQFLCALRMPGTLTAWLKSAAPPRRRACAAGDQVPGEGTAVAWRFESSATRSSAPVG